MRKTWIFMAIMLVFLLVAVGCAHSHDWEEADCTTPRHCSDCGETFGQAEGHFWTPATCTQAKQCTKCGETEGEPEAHLWLDSTCQEPKRCLNCGTVEGEPGDHSWKPGNDTTPEICSVCNEMKPLPLPESGQVFIQKVPALYSQLTIHASDYQSCYIKLKNPQMEDEFAFFVRAGDSITVDVPAREYYVYFAFGTEWYGTEYIFGEDTGYSKDEELCDFSTYTLEYTLEASYGGNFSDTPVDEEEFK